MPSSSDDLVPNFPLCSLSSLTLSRQTQQADVNNFWEQRKAFRLAALVALRKREGLPSPVDEHGQPLETRMDDLGNAVYYGQSGQKVDRVLFAGAGRDGKPGPMAQGTRKQDSEIVLDERGIARQVPTADVMAGWGPGGDGGFQILEVAEDGRTLADELRDLARDSTAYSHAERVSHGAGSEQAPGLELADLSDGEVDRRLQQYLKRGPTQ